MLYFYLSARIYNIYFWKYENEIDWDIHIYLASLMLNCKAKLLTEKYDKCFPFVYFDIMQ